MRLSSHLFLGLLLSVAGCVSGPSPASEAASSASASPPPATTEPAPRVFEIAPGYVLLGDWTELRAAPDDDAELGQAALTPRAEEYLSERRLWVMRVVEHRGQWLEVETVMDPSSHCVTSKWELTNFALHLFVRAEEALELTTQTVELPLGEREGGRVILGAGLPLISGSPDWIGSDFMLPVELPHEVIGRSYAAPERRDQGEWVSGSIELEALRESAGLPLPSAYSDSLIEVRELDDDALMAVLARGCIELHLRVAKGTYDPEGGEVWGGLTGTARDDDVLVLPPGAPLSWPDGSPAGSLRSSQRLEAGALEPPGADGRRCFEWALGRGAPLPADPSLTLCFDAALAEEL